MPLAAHAVLQHFHCIARCYDDGYVCDICDIRYTRCTRYRCYNRDLSTSSSRSSMRSFADVETSLRMSSSMGCRVRHCL